MATVATRVYKVTIQAIKEINALRVLQGVSSSSSADILECIVEDARIKEKQKYDRYLTLK